MLTGPPNVLSCSLFNPPSSKLDGHRDYVSCKLPTTHIFPVGSHASTAGGARPACRVLAHTPLPVVPDSRVLAHTTPDPPVVCSPMTPNHRGLGRRALTLLSLHSTGLPVGERGGTHHYTIALRRLPAFPTIATTGPVNPLSDRGTLLRVVHRTPPENPRRVTPRST